MATTWLDVIKPAKPKQPFPLTNLVLLVVIVVGYFAMVQLADRGFFENFRLPDLIDVPDTPEDETEPMDDSLDGTFVIAVIESKNRTAEQMKVINNWQFWNGVLPDMGIKWYLRDPDSEDAKSFVRVAKDNGIQPPFVMHCRGETPLWVIPFPKSADDILKLIKR